MVNTGHRREWYDWPLPARERKPLPFWLLAAWLLPAFLAVCVGAGLYIAAAGHYL